MYLQGGLQWHTVGMMLSKHCQFITSVNHHKHCALNVAKETSATSPSNCGWSATCERTRKKAFFCFCFCFFSHFSFLFPVFAGAWQQSEVFFVFSVFSFCLYFLTFCISCLHDRRRRAQAQEAQRQREDLQRRLRSIERDVQARKFADELNNREHQGLSALLPLHQAIMHVVTHTYICFCTCTYTFFVHPHMLRYVWTCVGFRHDTSAFVQTYV